MDTIKVHVLRIFASSIRRLMMTRQILSVLFLASTVAAHAQPGGATSNDLQLNTITTALPFMSITPDSRAGGMGDAGTALSASSTSIYWNTSMLNFSKETAEISVSYTPWLRQLTNDIHLSYLAGYYNINKRHAVGGSLRYFSLGEITFTSAQGDVLREDKPSEFEITGGYAFKLSDRTSVGLNGKFAYSNLTGGSVIPGVDTKPGIVGAADLSFTYFNPDARINGVKGDYIFAATINNIGNKVAYSNLVKRDFIPMNMKVATSYNARFDAYNSLTFAVELQKLLVPTPPIYDYIDNQQVLISGMNTDDVGVISGMLRSFYDAPGAPVKDDNGDYVQNPDGSFEITKGSKFKEELTEINIATGLEYWYNNTFAVRTGFFFENKNKGARQYFNFGIGFKYNKFGIDISYLAALSRVNPLANTLRFSLRMELGGPSDANNKE